MTFTRMATGELRERVRERLVAPSSALASVARRSAGAGRRRGGRAADERERDRWSSSAASRLANAIADFDAATIATTHGFCQEVLGRARDARRPRARRRRSWNGRRSDRGGRRRPLRAALLPAAAARRSTRAEAARDRSDGVENPTVPRAPAGGARGRAAGDAPAARASRRATSSNGASARLAMLTYDDLLTRLRDTLAEPTARAAPGCGPATGRADRRVPGHRPGPVGDRRAGVRRRAT